METVEECVSKWNKGSKEMKGDMFRVVSWAAWTTQTGLEKVKLDDKRSVPLPRDKECEAYCRHLIEGTNRRNVGKKEGVTLNGRDEGTGMNDIRGTRPRQSRTNERMGSG
jgi:hypothetical protein